jgi:quercetin dioxygenase-like cupin family protein
MEHRPAEGIEWVEAPAENFTGKVRFGPLSQDGELNALGVSFEPGARTDWHWHPEGQVLYVTEGAGLVQDDDGTTVEVSAGDTVFTPADQIHWHGARPNTPMTHLSLTTGGATVWEPRKVTDEEYNSRG